MTKIIEQMPPLGKDIIGYEKDRTPFYVFLCNSSGKEWRSSITGSMLMVDIVEWEEIPETQKFPNIPYEPF